MDQFINRMREGLVQRWRGTPRPLPLSKDPLSFDLDKVAELIQSDDQNAVEELSRRMQNCESFNF